ncbi:flagellar hook-associated protein FlgL [Pollutimonas bauzanensis]|uniref:Flagellar hook-associated protein 3 FlgL n=1 Tax=Pollutimonas bauzanensis TaxID=658167 RepID=A0A1M5Z4F3_9BURK|nr:flagellar hook-associated protein FlgL [Pollutimonas bauzanensis]SHI19142.1 flagellar hook-associated protein 3 FlgL [Pollutimonas bauzanensis]
MRISSTLFFQTGLNSINAQQSDLMHLYQQVASGQRMVTPADDPLAAAQAINISQSQSLNARFAANRDVAKTNLGTAENALNSVTTLMQDVKTRLVEAGNGTLSDADRATLSNVLISARSNLLGLANSTDGSGQYLFSGAQGGTAAFQEVGGRIVYMGDTGQRKIQADQTRQIPGSDVGSDIFNRPAPGTSGYLTKADTAGNIGTGLISTATITDAKGVNIGNAFKITFTSPTEYTIEVRNPAGAAVLPAVTGTYTPGTDTSLTLPGGVQVKFSGAPEAGDSFTVDPISLPAYAATALPGNSNAATMSSPIAVDPALADSGNVFTIKYVEATDSYEVEVKDAGGNVLPTDPSYSADANGVLKLPYGMQVKVAGTPADGDTFEVRAADSSNQTDLNIFDTLDSIIAALATPMEDDPVAAAKFQNILASAMQRLDVNYNNVLTVRASVGSRLNEIEALDANGSMRALSYSSQLSKLEEVDYYTATTQLQLRTSALEAASLAFKKIQSIGLFNMSSN